MTTQEFNKKADALLINFIKNNGYVNSGSLISSIKFSSTQTSNGNFNIKLSANDYIQYLEDGKFLDRFFESKEFLDLYGTVIQDMIYKELD